MVEAESRTVAEFHLAAIAHEPDYTSDAVVAWGSGSALDVDFEPRVDLGFAASEAGMEVPFENTQGYLEMAQFGAIVEVHEPLSKPELEENDLFVVGMCVEGQLASAVR